MIEVESVDADDAEPEVIETESVDGEPEVIEVECVDAGGEPDVTETECVDAEPEVAEAVDDALTSDLPQPVTLRPSDSDGPATTVHKRPRPPP